MIRAITKVRPASSCIAEQGIPTQRGIVVKHLNKLDPHFRGKEPACFLLTGPTAYGKSTLLALLADPKVALLVDPLGSKNRTWSEPEHIGVRLIAFDHVAYLPNAAEQVEAAARWCARHNATLLLCEQTRSVIEERGITLPDDVVELHLCGTIGQADIEFRQGTHAQRLTPLQARPRIEALFA